MHVFVGLLGPVPDLLSLPIVPPRLKKTAENLLLLLCSLIHVFVGLLGAVPLRLRRESGRPGHRSRGPLHGRVLDDLRQLRLEPVDVRLQFGRFPPRCRPDDQVPLLQVADVTHWMHCVECVQS